MVAIEPEGAVTLPSDWNGVVPAIAKSTVNWLDASVSNVPSVGEYVYA
jgi:hypothetical protein